MIDFVQYLSILVMQTTFYFLMCTCRVTVVLWMKFFNNVLNEIEQTVHKINPLHVIVGGDLNTDFSRSTYHSRVLREFIQAQDMTVLY